MTISSDVRKAGPFAGNGTTTSFPFAFLVFSEDDVVVVFTDADSIESTLALGTDYTVTLNADQNASPGGTVDLPAALATGTKLTLTSSVAALQPTDLTNQGGFYPGVITRSLDRLTVLIQQLYERMGRAVVTPISGDQTGQQYLDGLVEELATLAGQTAVGQVQSDLAVVEGRLDGHDSQIANIAASFQVVDWTPGQTYGPGTIGSLTDRRAITLQGGVWYIAAVEHVAGAVFADDYAAGKWISSDAAQLAGDLLTVGAGKGAGMVVTRTGQTVEQRLPGSVNVTAFYEDSDGSDYSPALSRALAASDHVIFPNDRAYSISSPCVETLTTNKTIDFDRSEVSFTSYIRLSGAQVSSGLVLSAPVAAGDVAVSFVSIGGALAGDLLCINTSIAVESGWGYTKKDCVQIKSISGNVATLYEPLNFGYTSSDSGLSIEIRHPVSVHLGRPNFKLTSVSGQAMMEMHYLNDVTIDKPVAYGPLAFDPASEINRRAFQLYFCANTQIDSPVFERLSYPVLVVGGTRNTQVTEVVAKNCRHIVEPADWAKTVFVDGVNAVDCYASVSSHPAFDVHYSRVNGEKETGLPNLRCIGGSLKSVKVQTLADDTVSGPYFHNVALNAAFVGLYANKDIVFDDVDFDSPNRTLPTVGARFGRVVDMRRVRCSGFSPGSLNSVGRVVIGAGCSFAGSATPKKYRGGFYAFDGVRSSVTVVRNPVVPAYIDGGVYHIDPSKTVVDQEDKHLICRGQIVAAASGEPAVLPLRIHTNAFCSADSPGLIFGVLKLKASVRHSNSGQFSRKESWFNFIQGTNATSTLTFPLVPIFSSGLSGQANESIAIAISSPTFAGVTQLGANHDFYVQVDVSLSSGRTSPFYYLEYELELTRA